MSLKSFPAVLASLSPAGLGSLQLLISASSPQPPQTPGPPSYMSSGWGGTPDSPKAAWTSLQALQGSAVLDRQGQRELGWEQRPGLACTRLAPNPAHGGPSGWSLPPNSSREIRHRAMGRGSPGAARQTPYLPRPLQPHCLPPPSRGGTESSLSQCLVSVGA